MNHFSRGTVVKVKFPKYSYDPKKRDDLKLTPLPHSVIHGVRKAIILTDSSLHFPKKNGRQMLSQKQIAVIPISSAESDKKNDRILPTYLKLDHNKYDFLDRECYALANQIITIPIHWITERPAQGCLDEEDMFILDSYLLISTGTLGTVKELAKNVVEKEVQKEVQRVLEQLDQDA